MESLKDKVIEFCEITERNISVLVLPSLWLLFCMILGTIILKIATKIVELDTSIFVSISQFAATYAGIIGFGIMVFGLITYFLEVSRRYSIAKKRYYRAY